MCVSVSVSTNQNEVSHWTSTDSKKYSLIYTMKVTFLKCQILMFYSVLECKKRKSRSHGNRKNCNIKRKFCTEKRLNTSLKDLSIALNNHGQHG